jgi:hypothetical protein
MNINKKYAVFGVAAVIAVAGVIYFGTSANQQASVANVADKLSGPIIPIDEPTTPSTPVVTEFQWRKLCRDGKPHIRVTSPNGGEVYQDGQQVTVKWKSCNLLKSEIINIGVDAQPLGYYGVNAAPNTGSTNFVIHGVNANNPFGLYYKMHLYVDTREYIEDRSDNLFTVNTPDPWATLCADRKPHVQVLSPNGDEQYYAGSQITMKWKTCNIPADKKITLILNDTVHNIGGDLAVLTANDGSELVTLPTTATWNPLYSGKFYKARASFATFGGYTPIQLTDESDALFTIKDNSVQVDVCWNIPGFQTTIPNGMIWDTPGNCVPGGTTSPNGGGTPTTTSTWDTLCADGKPHVQVLSPNGGETYTAGNTMIIRWKTCNIPTNNNVGLSIHSSITTASSVAELGDTINDGNQKITIPTIGSGNAPLASGNFYKVNIYSGPNTGNDFSDNTFTINNGPQ